VALDHLAKVPHRGSIPHVCGGGRRSLERGGNAIV
jgi:hypothetical protein